ncbi:hypothetical protein [Paracoccus laeviglucosivorans]|uniref:Uncharacterized protein n=1 Tax=Paracoccus laeviglucosivorans TaxID=1197861 RepID=A0A521AT47_9RHOB|nr:hypothetical protein [Paracoccus laeviglucosivorans]SMO37976.1 hypothetical protein SAMN06265221_101333 [Paracoccus laeviglucosivorans]
MSCGGAGLGYVWGVNPESLPMRRHLLAALLLIAPAAHAQTYAPAPSDGAPRVMMCELLDQSGTGWVPDFLMMTRQVSGPHAGRIEVFDPILQNLVRRPIQAVVTADGRRSITYGWALAGVRNQSGQYAERLDYRLSVRKSDGTAQMTVIAAGYENTMRGEGRCMTPEG